MSHYTNRLVEQSDGVKSHRDLNVWWKSLDLVDDVYELTRSFPRWEDFGLRCQMTRAAIRFRRISPKELPARQRRTSQTSW